MATLTDYKGLQVLSGTPSGDGGEAINDDLKILADRAARVSTAAPTSSDDSGKGFFVGSTWMDQGSTSGAWYMCTDPSSGAAVWKSLWFRDADGLCLVPGEDGNVGIHTQDPKTMLHLEDTSGSGNAIIRLMGYGDNTSGTRLGAIQIYNNDTSQQGPQVAGQVTGYSCNANGAGCDIALGTTDGSDDTSTNPPPERMRLTGLGDLGIGTSTPKARLHATGSTILGTADSVVADGDLGNGQVNISVDESNNNLVFKVKYSNGTVKSGTVALT